MPLPTTHSDPTTLWIVHKINKQLNTVVLMGPFRNARSTPFWFCHTFLPPKDNNLVMENLRMETADIHSKLKIFTPYKGNHGHIPNIVSLFFVYLQLE